MQVRTNVWEEVSIEQALQQVPNNMELLCSKFYALSLGCRRNPTIVMGRVWVPFDEGKHGRPNDMAHDQL